jgi:hypothetical protein
MAHWTEFGLNHNMPHFSAATRWTSRRPCRPSSTSGRRA